jgi:hypothetical protein
VGETLQTVQELIDESGPVDVTWIYEQWRDELATLMARVTERFELTQDPSTRGLEVAGELGAGIHGQSQCFVGPEIDWLVYSWMADPKNGFANLHLTISPSAAVDVPTYGLAFANFGRRPWAYVDSVPRRELMVNREYYFKYFEPLNAQWMRWRQDPGLDYFTSPTAYIRATVSPTAFCFSGQMDQPTVDTFMSTAREHLDRWIGWMDGADPVPVAERPALQAHTTAMRRTIAELDPANAVAIRLFGQQTCDRLVESLWGAHREIAHPGL